MSTISSVAGRQRTDKRQSFIYLPIYRFCWHKWKNPYHIHLGYSIARLYQSINTKLHNDIA
ncbi:hypothetical protein [Moraxella catarrhalis]|uniref:hypothetical protein n=1 Tax=Moraxella catarrhalis TaxID=480 RepID=UPI0007F508B6|nr:hypothetical protein [Moraxella catarrhalis]OAV02787.1 hypothetical protein AO381_1340 [Moraxella catarrhalis]